MNDQVMPREAAPEADTDLLATLYSRLHEAAEKQSYITLTAAECHKLCDDRAKDNWSAREERIAHALEELAQTNRAMFNAVSAALDTAAVGSDPHGRPTRLSLGMVVAAVLQHLMQRSPGQSTGIIRGRAL